MGLYAKRPMLLASSLTINLGKALLLGSDGLGKLRNVRLTV
jgi:hypothetical protein